MSSSFCYVYFSQINNQILKEGILDCSWPSVGSAGTETAHAMTASCVGLGNEAKQPRDVVGFPVPGFDCKGPSCLLPVTLFLCSLTVFSVHVPHDVEFVPHVVVPRSESTSPGRLRGVCRGAGQDRVQATPAPGDDVHAVPGGRTLRADLL